MAAQPATRRLRNPVAPLIPIVLAVAVGILWDRFAAPRETTAWFALTFAAMLAAGISRKHPAVARSAVLLAFAGLAAAGHHARWWDVPPDDVSRIATSREQPAWLRGVIVELPDYRPAIDRTRLVLDVTETLDGTRRHPASGRVQATVPGDRTDLMMGCPVFATGRLAEIDGPKNPGEIDYCMLMRSHGIRAQLSIPTSEGVWPDAEGRSWPWCRLLGGMRSWSARRLESGLDPDVAPIASALLLGRRSLVPSDVNDAFARTGTTHLLAISGLHLQVLALTLGWICMLFGVSRKRSCGIVGLATVIYGFLVGWSPSVTRSIVMTLVFCLGLVKDRRPGPANLLAIAALATLALNPANLFDIGCQLSFLAVATLFWIVAPCVQRIGQWVIWPRKDPETGRFFLKSRIGPLDELERSYAPRWLWAVRWVRWWLVEGVLLSAVLWLVALPLVALRFHLASPIGILLNVPLVPLTSLALMLAGATLILSALHPAIALPAAWLCRLSLRVCQSFVLWGERQGWGHWFVAGPSWWWVLGFYALLGFAAWRWNVGESSAESPLPNPRTRPAVRFRPAAIVFCVWMLVPLMTRYVLSKPRAPIADVLAVDHGLSVILQAEPRHATLYDCGRMRDPRVGRRVIAPALWACGIERLDAVVLSHADSDHYNGLPDLLDRIPIGAVLIPPGFGGDQNGEAGDLLKLVRSRGIPVREITAGDQIPIGSHVNAIVVHPAADFAPNAPDNARSVVLEMAYQRGRILLTGDLDGEGRTAMLGRGHERYDAVLSPHHGGRTANPPEFYDWARPGLVVASQREPAAGSTDALRSLKPPLLRTWNVGAVRFAWEDSGLSTSTFLSIGSPIIRLQNGALPDPAPSPVVRLAAVLLGALAGLGLCALLAIVEWGAWTLVRPGRSRTPSPEEPPGWTPISMTAADGVLLRGAWRAGSNADGRSVLLLHGFGEDRSRLIDRASWLADQGFGVALLDSRGRGESEGPFTTFGAREYADLALWVSSIRTIVGEHAPIFAWGRSMGSAIALRAAAEGVEFAGLILEAPYADLVESVGSWLTLAGVPRFFAGPILWRAATLCGVALRSPRPIDLAAVVNSHVLILHGEADPIVPPPEAARLAESFASPPRVLAIPGARHNDVFPLAGADDREAIAAFLSVGCDRVFAKLDRQGGGV